MDRSLLQELTPDNETASIEEIATAINATEQKSLDFWETQYEQARDTLDRSILVVQDTKATVLEFIKIDLLFGSVIAALYQYGIINVTELPSYFVVLPFAFLLASSIVFIYTYFTLGGTVVGPGSGNLHQTLVNDQGEKEHYKTLAPVYYQWSDKNLEINQTSSLLVSVGISFTFAALGTVSAIYVFL